jgi:hypothetical protein
MSVAPKVDGQLACLSMSLFIHCISESYQLQTALKSTTRITSFTNTTFLLYEDTCIKKKQYFDDVIDIMQEKLGDVITGIVDAHTGLTFYLIAWASHVLFCYVELPLSFRQWITLSTQRKMLMVFLLVWTAVSLALCKSVSAIVLGDMLQFVKLGLFWIMALYVACFAVALSQSILLLVVT